MIRAVLLEHDPRPRRTRFSDARLSERPACERSDLASAKSGASDDCGSRSRASSENFEAALAGTALHWDLIVYTTDGAAGKTWRLDCNPLFSDSCEGEPNKPRRIAIAEHRATYWQYEGELTRDRGTIRRLARGTVGPPLLTGSSSADLEAQIDAILELLRAAVPAIGFNA